jgi:2-iminobutanoate/2-iminopropanoate deaminase
MEKKQLVKPAGPYSHAVVSNDLVFVSGQLPINQQTNQMELDLELAINQVFINLNNVLLNYGSNLESLLKVNIFLTNKEQIETFNHLYKQYIKEPFPARTMVVVKDLPRNALLMIDAIAKKRG